MRLIPLLVLLVGLSLSKRPLSTEYIEEIKSNNQWEDSEEVRQPPRPVGRRYGRYQIKLLRWTTNQTQFFEWNDREGMELHMNTEDIGIVCKYDRTKVVIRLVPADKADSCEFDGGVVAHCPDLVHVPLSYADVRGPGNYVLTTFSDGTPEGLHSTSGGFCKQGLKFPVYVKATPRDKSKFMDEPFNMGNLPLRPNPDHIHQPNYRDDSDTQSASTVSIPVSLLLVYSLIRM